MLRPERALPSNRRGHVRHRTGGSEAAEVMLALEHVSRCLHALHVERRLAGPAAARLKNGRVLWVQWRRQPVLIRLGIALVRRFFTPAPRKCAARM